MRAVVRYFTACVFALANKGTICGHCRLTWATAISSTVRYTELSPDQGLLATMGVLRFNRLRSWTGQDFYSALEVWADSRETCTTLGERPHLG